MAQLLAIDEDVISDGIASLYQTDYINPLSKELTPKGYEYLEKNHIDSFEKREMDVLIDALNGDFDINVNSHMSQSVAKSNNLSCIRCYIQQPTIDNIVITIWKGHLSYPELQRVIDKIRVYRNKDSHYKLDESNAKLYEESCLRI